MIVSNSSALWSARAWLQSSRILSSSRRFGTLTAEPFYPQIGAACDTAHTVFLGGTGCPPFVFLRMGFRGCLRRGISWWFVQRPRSSSAAMILISYHFRKVRDEGWGTCATQIQATAELALGLDSRGRLSLRGGGCPYAGGFRYVDGRGRPSLH